MKVCRCLPYTLLLTLLSCNSEDSFLPNDIIVNNDNENNQYIDHNRWTYEMMSKHYFWNKDIADSLSLDFSISPKSFFDNLLSKEDRFSWCEINENYNGEDLGFQYQTYEIHGSIVNRVLYVTSTSLIEKGLKQGDYFIIGLRPYMDVMTIGTTSCGKDVGSYTMADNRININYNL